MDNTSKKETMMFVAVPGSEPYAEVPKTQVKEQLDKGLLKQSALIWSAKHNTWKQARHITQLIASKLQPRPAQAPLAAAAKPAVAKAPSVAKAPAAAAQPKAAAAKSPAPAVTTKAKAPAAAAPASDDHNLIPQHRTPTWLKVLCAALVAIIIGLAVLNWYYVDNALKSNLAQDNSAFKDVPVYAHLGGFFQADIAVLHLGQTDKLTADNFVQYLAAVAAATPDRPMSTRTFGTISLASGWGADYYISGRNWSRLGNPKLSDDDRRAILLEGVYSASGDRLSPKTNLSVSAQQELEVKNWNAFVKTFVRK